MKNLIKIFLFLSLFCPNISLAAKNNLDNVVIVFDASGSMSDRMRNVNLSKIDAAKQSMCDVINTIPKTTNIGIVVFSNDTRKQPWIYPLAPKDANKINEAINSINPSGGTPLGSYMKAGADTLLVARARNHGYGTYKLLVVTDGEAEDPDLVDRNSKDILIKGIELDVIGVDMWNDHTLSKLAHSYKRADDPTSFKKAISDVFAEVPKGSDSVSDFSILEGFPNEVAFGIIKTISERHDSFIGEKKTVVTSIENKNAVVSNQTTSAKDGFGFTAFLIVLVVVLFGFMIMIVSKTFSESFRG